MLPPRPLGEDPAVLRHFSGPYGVDRRELFEVREELLLLKRAVAHAHGFDPVTPTSKLVTALYALAAERGGSSILR